MMLDEHILSLFQSINDGVYILMYKAKKNGKNQVCHDIM